MDNSHEQVRATQENEVAEQSNHEVITNDQDIEKLKGDQDEASQQKDATVGGAEPIVNDSTQSDGQETKGHEENINLAKTESEGNGDPTQGSTNVKPDESTAVDVNENHRKEKDKRIDGSRETKNNGAAGNDERDKSKDDGLGGKKRKEQTQQEVSDTTAGKTDRNKRTERKEANAKSKEVGSLNEDGHHSKESNGTGENAKKKNTSQTKSKDKNNDTPKTHGITNDSADTSEHPTKSHQRTRHREGKIYGKKKVSRVMATAISERLHRMSIGNSKSRKEEETTQPSKKLSPEAIEEIVERLNQAKKDYTEANQADDSSKNKMLSQDEIEALTDRLSKNKPETQQLGPQRNTLIEGKHFEGLNADEKREKIEDMVRRLNQAKNPRTPDSRRNITGGYREQGIFLSYIAQQ